MTRLARLSIVSAFAVFVGARPAAAQVPISPSGVSFAYDDASMTLASAFQVDFFQCASLLNGACQGQATTPMQSVTVPKANVTTLVPVAPDTNNRLINLKAAPVTSVLTAFPAGVPFVLALAAVPDPNAGAVGGNSADSAPTAPFFAAGKAVPVVTGARVIK